MKTLLRILLGIVVVIVLVVAVVYLDGMTLPVNHSTTVTQTMNASPDKVFAQITNVAAGATWRPGVKGVAERDVLLDVPGATYGGTWTYKLSPGPIPGTTTLSITEAGFINPPLYRFMMHHIFGMDYNINTYFKDLNNALKS